MVESRRNPPCRPNPESRSSSSATPTDEPEHPASAAFESSNVWRGSSGATPDAAGHARREASSRAPDGRQRQCNLGSRRQESGSDRGLVASRPPARRSRQTVSRLFALIGRLACHARESGHPVLAAALDSRFRGNDKAAARALIQPVSPATFSQGEKGRRPHPALRATPGSSPGTALLPKGEG
jgi:hypothetical protein